ncbi:hypothetical protein AOLI_G00000620 [Acnodon oligacanthus]
MYTQHRSSVGSSSQEIMTIYERNILDLRKASPGYTSSPPLSSPPIEPPHGARRRELYGARYRPHGAAALTSRVPSSTQGDGVTVEIVPVGFGASAPKFYARKSARAPLSALPGPGSALRTAPAASASPSAAAAAQPSLAERLRGDVSEARRLPTNAQHHKSQCEITS